MKKAMSASERMAMRAAAALVDEVEPEAVADATEKSSLASDTAPHAEEHKSKGGRPKGKRDVAGRATVHLDAARLKALHELAEDRGRSVHSLIIEGIDAVIGKPTKTVWKDI